MIFLYSHSSQNTGSEDDAGSQSLIVAKSRRLLGEVMEATQAENELKEAYLISGIASSLNDELAASVEALSM